MQKTQNMQVQSLGQKDPLDKEMATHSSILFWKINEAWEDSLKEEYFKNANIFGTIKSVKSL